MKLDRFLKTATYVGDTDGAIKNNKKAIKGNLHFNIHATPSRASYNRSTI